MHKPNIFNIPSNYHFFHSLLHYLEQNFTDFSKVKLFLPNRRSCRELKKILLEQKKIIILPRIKAISDITYEDLFPHAELDEIISNKVLNKLDYLFFLSKEIQNLALFGENLNFEIAFKIAMNLQNLFDDLESEEIELNNLDNIANHDLSLHRQLTLEFLQNFYLRIKNDLIRKNISSISSNQNLIIEKFISSLQKSTNPDEALVIAGSTGSLLHSRKLIKAISQLQNGHVILYGLKKEQELIDYENHAEFFLNKLITELGIDKKTVAEIKEEKFLLSSENRQKMISLMMLPDLDTIKWQTAEKIIDIEDLSKDLARNFTFIEADNEVAEAKIIRNIITQNPHKKIAIISNNDRLINLIKVNFRTIEINFNDSRNLGIVGSSLVNFLLLILELKENFDSATLLALLKHPLCIYSQQEKLLQDFEIKILRQQRQKDGIEGIKQTIERIADEELQCFFNDFFTLGQWIHSIDQEHSLLFQISKLIITTENFTKKSFAKLLENEIAQVEIFEFFTKLKAQENINLKNSSLLNTFKILLSQVGYFEKSNPNSNIDILSTIEARLLNFDLLIIASLNEGEFPEGNIDNYLGRKIRKDLGIEKNLKKIGQNAYDFCNYLSNKSVVLTRSKTFNNTTISPSPFLLKLQILCQKVGLKLNNQATDFLVKEYSEEVAIERSNPKPAVKYRPEKISITEISKLISDPYFIYAKKILKLKELPKIDFTPSYAEFGSFVHKALEEFVKNPQDDDFLKKAKNIFKKYFLAEEMELIWWVKFENIFNNFLKENKNILGKNYLEIPVTLTLKNITVNGKIDRIIADSSSGIEIFDYKTGYAASKDEVFSGHDPQLTIAALAIIEGCLEDLDISKNIEIKSLNYWKLSALSKSEIKIISEDNEEIKLLIAAAKSGIERLFEYFSQEENGYISTPNQENYRQNEYWHLARHCC